MPFINTHLVLEWEKLKVEMVGLRAERHRRRVVLEELWAQLLPDAAGERSQQTSENVHQLHSLWPCTSVLCVSMATASLLPSKSCPDLPLRPILTQNYAGKGLLGNIVPA